MDTKYLYVVLTRSNTILSNLIHFIKEDEYTHAALALDSNLDYMFSFGRRTANNPFFGCFKRETLNEGLFGQHKVLPGLVMKIQVTQDTYLQAKQIIEEFLLNSHRYEYNYLGLVNGLLGIGSYSHNRFLCSEFVYYVLQQCGICDLDLPRNLVRPQDLLHINGSIAFKGDLKQYVGLSAARNEPFQILTLA